MQAKQSILLNILTFQENPDEAQFIAAIEGLAENDATLRLRETVKHIDELIQLEYVEALEPYYESNENITIKYLNGAISIQPSLLKVTERGKEWLSHEGQRTFSKSENPLMTILTYVVTFLFGMASMYILMGIK